MNNFPKNKPLRFIKFFSVLLIMASLVTLTGCDRAKNQLEYDRGADLTRDDYRDALSPPVSYTHLTLPTKA